MKGSELMCLMLLFAASSFADTSEKGFETNSEYVTFQGVNVTLTCPETSEVKWSDSEEQSTLLVLPNYKDKANKLYHCEVMGKKHYFFIKAKVCKDCVEMGTSMTLVIMFGDVLVALGVICLVYACAKKKSSPAPPQRATQPRQPNAPRPPEPDYQALNPATRSRDVYAEAGRRVH